MVRPSDERRIARRLAAHRQPASALVTRSPQGVTLNAAGDYLLTHAAEITRDLYQARRGALKAAGREGAALAIAATHALSFTFFPSWIRAHAPLESLGTVNVADHGEAGSRGRLATAGGSEYSVPVEIRLFRATDLTAAEADIFWRAVSLKHP